MFIQRLLIPIAILVAASVYGQSEWKVEKDQNGIRIETRVTDLSPIKEFRAFTRVNAPFEEVARQLIGVEHHSEWMNDVSFAERISESPEVLRYNIKTPFPMKDRYIVVEVKTTNDDSTLRLEMESSDITPDNIDDQVHIPVVKGYWFLKKVDANTTDVQYQFLSDPGLAMPDWLVNAFVVNSPYKTLRQLKDRIE